MQNKILIFDMDGVILDSEPLHQQAREMMYEKYKIKQDQSLPDPVGKSSSGFWELIREKNGLTWDSDQMEAEQYHLVAEQVKEKHILPTDGLQEVLDWAKTNGWKVGLASSSSRVLVERVLELLDIRQYFDTVVTGDEVKSKKPAPDVYENVLRLSGITCENAMAVEDSSAGIAAAKGAGIYCYGYKNVSSGAQDLSLCDCVIENLREIMADTLHTAPQQSLRR